MRFDRFRGVSACGVLPGLKMAFLLICAGPTGADVPRVIHYQGRLLTSGGAPAVGAVSLRVRLYDHPTASTSVQFDETHGGVALTRGLFSLLIGANTVGGVPDSVVGPSPNSVWLGVSVNGGAELSPRTRLASSPFALAGRSAEQLVKPGTADPAVVVDAAGRVGVGTAPLSAVDVAGSVYSRMYTLVDGTTINVDWDNGNTQTVTLGGDRTIALANGRNGGHYALLLIQDGQGGRTATWPSSVHWTGGTAPTLTSTAGAVDIAHFVCDGATYFGFLTANHADTPPPVLLFADDFNRANGGTVGNGWSEGWRYFDMTSISSNKLRLTNTSDGNANGGGWVSRSSGQHNNLKILLTLEASIVNPGGHVPIGVLGPGTTGATGGTNHPFTAFGAELGARSPNGTTSLVDGTSSVSTPFTWTQGVTYNVELLIGSDYSRELRVWPVGNSRPSSPTQSAGATTPNSNGGYWQIGGDTGTVNAFDVRVDDFEVWTPAN